MTDLVENLTDSKVCVVGFASMGEDCGGGIPPFEWARTFGDLGVSTVLMRDRHLCWYQRGVEGVGDVEDVAGYVAELRMKYDRVITVGISMGGYAAILFGVLGDATEVVAMSPQTLLRDDDRWNNHWRDHVRPVMRYEDLRPVCAGKTRLIRCYIGEVEPYFERDFAHALRVADVERIVIVPGCTHSSVGPYLRDSGFFRDLVK